MEPIQQQITTLAHKVDLVYEILDRLYHNVAEDVDGDTGHREEKSINYSRHQDDASKIESSATRRGRLDASNYRKAYTDLPHGVNSRHDSTDWAMAQQDILIDSSGVEITHHQIKEQDLSPQIQIQRLTAQLTAAYNRIAALEEQLLAKRWK
jgi:hypothetical protein